MKRKLTIIFEIVNIRLVSFYLGLKVPQNWGKKTIKLFQPAYIQKVLAKYIFNKANPTNTSIKKVTLLSNLSNTTKVKKKKY